MDPLLVTVAFQVWVTVWPLAKVHVTVQPLIAELPAVTWMSPWKPPCHWPTIEYVAAQVPPPAVGVVVGVADGVADGVPVGVTDGVAVGPPPKMVASLAVALMPLAPLKIRWPQVVSRPGSKFVAMSRIGSLLPLQDHPR